LEQDFPQPFHVSFVSPPLSKYRCIPISPYQLLMAAAGPTADILTADEAALMVIATRLDSGLRRYEETDAEVNVKRYVSCISIEMVRREPDCITGCSNTAIQNEVARIFERYPNVDDDGPRMHPIVHLVAQEWDDAAVHGQVPDLYAIKLPEVARMCTDAASENPSWPPELYTQNLRGRLSTVRPADMWWLTPDERNQVVQGMSMPDAFNLFDPIAFRSSSPSAASSSSSCTVRDHDTCTCSWPGAILARPNSSSQ
jgi:hypothetical protein